MHDSVYNYIAVQATKSHSSYVDDRFAFHFSTVKTCNEEYQTHLKIFANETAFYDNCVSPQILGKSTNGSLSLSDTLRCYLPKCDRSSKFTPKQCGYLYFNHWCWCTQPDGTIIPDTFQQNMPNGFCSKSFANCQTTHMHGYVVHIPID